LKLASGIVDLFAVLSAHADPFGKPTPSDPAKPIPDITGAWDALRKRAGVQCRLHDLRHTAATKMAEAGVPESTMLALMGHMSRAMLERYSHIRIGGEAGSGRGAHHGEGGSKFRGSLYKIHYIRRG
jgi:integrase